MHTIVVGIDPRKVADTNRWHNAEVPCVIVEDAVAIGVGERRRVGHIDHVGTPRDAAGIGVIRVRSGVASLDGRYVAVRQGIEVELHDVFAGHNIEVVLAIHIGRRRHRITIAIKHRIAVSIQQIHDDTLNRILTDILHTISVRIDPHEVANPNWWLEDGDVVIVFVSRRCLVEVAVLVRVIARLGVIDQIVVVVRIRS